MPVGLRAATCPDEAGATTEPKAAQKAKGGQEARARAHGVAVDARCFAPRATERDGDASVPPTGKEVRHRQWHRHDRV